MALKATIGLIDSLGTEVVKRVECEATTLVQVLLDLADLVEDLEAVTDLGVTNISITEKTAAFASAAAEASSVDAGATFRLRLASGGVASHKIPGFPIAKVGGNRAIDPEDSDVAAYFANYEAAGAFTLSDGETITEVLSGTFDV
jgi:hypothetical protein